MEASLAVDAHMTSESAYETVTTDGSLSVRVCSSEAAGSEPDPEPNGPDAATSCMSCSLASLQLHSWENMVGTSIAHCFAIFRAYGWCILPEPLLTSAECQSMHSFLSEQLESFMTDSNMRGPTIDGQRGRFSLLGEQMWACPETMTMLQNRLLLDALDNLLGSDDKYGRWHITKAAGDCAGPRCSSMEMHSDRCYPLDLWYADVTSGKPGDWRRAAKHNGSNPELWHFTGHERVDHIALSVVVAPIAACDGPLEVSDWPSMNAWIERTKCYGPPALDVDDVVCHSLHGLPVGSAIIRDIRCWHRGAPNFSDKPRILPGALFSSQCGMSYGYLGRARNNN